jgi:hypothetical protein
LTVKSSTGERRSSLAPKFDALQLIFEAFAERLWAFTCPAGARISVQQSIALDDVVDIGCGADANQQSAVSWVLPRLLGRTANFEFT